jgi:hypothetical protein
MGGLVGIGGVERSGGGLAPIPPNIYQYIVFLNHMHSLQLFIARNVTERGCPFLAPVVRRQTTYSLIHIRRITHDPYIPTH